MPSSAAELLTVTAIARRLGVSRERARVVVTHKNFPAPVNTAGRVRLWAPADVEAWIREHRPDKATRPEGGPR